MAPIELTVEIDRTPAEVYPYVTDPARFPEWQTDVVAVRPGDGGFVQVRRFGGAEHTLTQRVVAAEPPRRWAVEGVDGPIRPDVAIVIEPLDGGARSRLTFAFDYAGHGLGELLLPLVRRMTAKHAPHGLSRLKQRLECAGGSARGRIPTKATLVPLAGLLSAGKCWVPVNVETQHKAMISHFSGPV